MGQGNYHLPYLLGIGRYFQSGEVDSCLHFFACVCVIVHKNDI